MKESRRATEKVRADNFFKRGVRSACGLIGDRQNKENSFEGTLAHCMVKTAEDGDCERYNA